METVFRSSFARPGFPTDKAIRVHGERWSPLQNELVAARSKETARTQMMKIVGKYAGAPGIARDYSAYALGTAWAALETFLASSPLPKLDDLEKEIQHPFCEAPSALVHDEKLIADDVRGSRDHSRLDTATDSPVSSDSSTVQCAVAIMTPSAGTRSPLRDHDLVVAHDVAAGNALAPAVADHQRTRAREIP